MPTAASTTYTNDVLMPMFPAIPHPELPIKLTVSTVYAKGTVLAELTATPGTYGVYADAGTGGLGVAKCILKYACAVDGSGNITFGTAATGGQFGETYKTAPAYFGGTFKTTELTGIDAAALLDLAGSLMYGSIADGVIKF